ncbi:hypothetical protein E5163_11015 [Marinicauda algicola]|uniref:Nucleoside-diphosphate sugar epimerase n=1 Tax=Marinicauda algicola TaxID=2029849 RepID=A0A4S2GZ34_9PROT|nr:mitochondrial fission ELM1 family protein [Marinicauda algicola]TGY88343.1 hypothetical protein E5163_11015 [Marinicauda algicola]
MTSSERTCFVVFDGRRGIENQALGLAEAVARLTALRLMPVHVPRSGPIEEPGAIAPELWIGCGRAAVRASGPHRRAFPDCVMVYVQHPREAFERFDLIVPPRHDRIDGPNVFPILGSPNRITPARLAEGAAPFAERADALPAPRAAVLIGGDSKHHRFTKEAGDYLLDRLAFVRSRGVALMVTVSRRTPEDFTDVLRARFRRDPGVWLHDGDGANPYFAFLHYADWIFVTEDSTNMLTEAATAGKPVYRLGLDGDAGKFKRLYGELEAHGAMRPFLGRLERWDYTPLHETDRAARRVLEILDARAHS